MKRDSVIKILWGLALVLMMLALYMVFIYVPTEATMGIVQRIFYFHVPAAWAALLAYVLLTIGSVGFLWKHDDKWDRLALTSAEIGVVFTTMFLATGSIWAKPIWGVWWTWDARLTTALILWFIYIAYFMVRSYANSESRAARFGAVVAIVGFADMPIVALANTLWRAQHPGPVIFSGGLAPPMTLTLMTGLAAYSALFALLMVVLYNMKRDEQEIKQLKQDLDRGGN